MVQNRPPWNVFTCEEQVCYLWQAGPLKIWLKRIDCDWLIANELTGEENNATDWSQVVDKEEPSSLKWKRWPFNRKYEQIEISPVMSDRPLVVKTHIETSLPPGVTANFYVNLPLSAKLSVVSNPQHLEVVRQNSVALSNTWFGNHYHGELCYALKTRAIRKTIEASILPHRALCPVTISNKTEVALPIQKICVRAKHLNLYSSNQQLWTNRIKVIFRGEGLTSQVIYEKTPPNEIESPTPTPVQKAEEKPENGFLSTLGNSFMDLF